MVLYAPPISPPVDAVEEFDRFADQPENSGRDFELIAGRIVEKMVSRPRQSSVAARLLILMGSFVLQHKLGRVTGADGGYQVGPERYIPDVAYISKSRQPLQPDEAYNPLPPDLAVEVLSPSNTDDEMRIKIGNYSAAGTVVWVLDPDRQRVEVYQAGQPVTVLQLGAMLDGGAVLPGFAVALADLFAD
jgi:Uma2 family endonuclease